MDRVSGHVRKRSYEREGNKWWRWIATLEIESGGKRVRRSKSFARERDAKRWLEAEQSLAGEGLPLSGDSPRVSELLKEWLEHGRVTKDWSPSHLRRSQLIVAKDLALLALIPADRLTVRDVEKVLDSKRAAGAQPDTVRLIRAALSAALNLAIRRGVLNRNVAALAETPALRQASPRFLMPEEAATLLSALDEDRLGPLFKVALCLALRPSEVIGLRWQDVDLEKRCLQIAQNIQYIDGQYHVRRPKTEMSRRVIPIPQELVQVFRDQRVAQLEDRVHARSWEDTDLVFTGADGGPVYPPYANRRLRKIVESLGLPPVTFQELRHTGATLLLAMGAELAAIQELLGHTSINTTRRYARVVEPLKRDAANRMGAFLRSVREAKPTSAVPV